MIGANPTLRPGPDLRDRLIRFLDERAAVTIDSNVPAAFAHERPLLPRDLTTDALSMLTTRWIRSFWTSRRRASTAARRLSQAEGRP